GFVERQVGAIGRPDALVVRDGGDVVAAATVSVGDLRIRLCASGEAEPGTAVGMEVRTAPRKRLRVGVVKVRAGERPRRREPVNRRTCVRQNEQNRDQAENGFEQRVERALAPAYYSPLLDGRVAAAEALSCARGSA